MNLFQKIISTVVAFFVLGLIVTVLNEKSGVATGEGIISFILFILFVIVLIMIWRSKPTNENT